MTRFMLMFAGWLLLAATSVHAEEFTQTKFPIDPTTRTSLPKELAVGWLQKIPKQDKSRDLCVFNSEGISIGFGNPVQSYAAFRVTQALAQFKGSDQHPMILAIVTLKPKDGGFFDSCDAFLRQYMAVFRNTHALGPLSKSDIPRLVHDVTRTLEALAVLGVDISDVEVAAPLK